jgi:hypothetical protein
MGRALYSVNRSSKAIKQGAEYQSVEADLQQDWTMSISPGTFHNRLKSAGSKGFNKVAFGKG